MGFIVDTVFEAVFDAVIDGAIETVCFSFLGFDFFIWAFDLFACSACFSSFTF